MEKFQEAVEQLDLAMEEDGSLNLTKARELVCVSQSARDVSFTVQVNVAVKSANIKAEAKLIKKSLFLIFPATSGTEVKAQAMQALIELLLGLKKPDNFIDYVADRQLAIRHMSKLIPGNDNFPVCIMADGVALVPHKSLIFALEKEGFCCGQGGARDKVRQPGDNTARPRLYEDDFIRRAVGAEEHKEFPMTRRIGFQDGKLTQVYEGRYLEWDDACKPIEFYVRRGGAMPMPRGLASVETVVWSLLSVLLSDQGLTQVVDKFSKDLDQASKCLSIGELEDYARHSSTWLQHGLCGLLSEQATNLVKLFKGTSKPPSNLESDSTKFAHSTHETDPLKTHWDDAVGASANTNVDMTKGTHDMNQKEHMLAIRPGPPTWQAPKKL